MKISIRKIEPADKKRILKISSKIWGGHDYIPYVFDEWVKDRNSSFVCAELDGTIVGLGRYVRLTKDYVWLEGLRTAPAYQGHGVGNALTNYFIELGVKEGVETLALSTYIENYSIIHIIEKNGFRKVAYFIFFEALRKRKIFKEAQFTSIEKIGTEEAEHFISNSNFSRMSNGYFPYGWEFKHKGFSLKLVLKEADFILGMRDSGQIVGVACGGKVVKKIGTLSISFVDGTFDSALTLIKYFLNMKGKYDTIEFMVPMTLSGRSIQAIEAFRKLKIKNYHEYKPDVFVYEKRLKK